LREERGEIGEGDGRRESERRVRRGNQKRGGGLVGSGEAAQARARAPSAPVSRRHWSGSQNFEARRTTQKQHTPASLTRKTPLPQPAFCLVARARANRPANQASPCRVVCSTLSLPLFLLRSESIRRDHRAPQPEPQEPRRQLAAERPQGRARARAPCALPPSSSPNQSAVGSTTPNVARSQLVGKPGRAPDSRGARGRWTRTRWSPRRRPRSRNVSLRLPILELDVPPSPPVHAPLLTKTRTPLPPRPPTTTTTDTRLTQQELPACKPVLDPTWVRASSAIPYCRKTRLRSSAPLPASPPLVVAAVTLTPTKPLPPPKKKPHQPTPSPHRSSSSSWR
jgi:hypothetical protein